MLSSEVTAGVTQVFVRPMLRAGSQHLQATSGTCSDLGQPSQGGTVTELRVAKVKGRETGVSLVGQWPEPQTGFVLAPTVTDCVTLGITRASQGSVLPSEMREQRSLLQSTTAQSLGEPLKPVPGPAYEKLRAPPGCCRVAGLSRLRCHSSQFQPRHSRN